MVSLLRLLEWQQSMSLAITMPHLIWPILSYTGRVLARSRLKDEAELSYRNQKCHLQYPLNMLSKRHSRGARSLRSINYFRGQS